jgi:hypothetical protein
MFADFRSVIAVASVLTAFAFLTILSTRRRARHPMRFVDQRLFEPAQHARWR